MNNKFARCSVQKRSRFSASLRKSAVRMNKSEHADVFLSCSSSLLNNNNDVKRTRVFAEPALTPTELHDTIEGRRCCSTRRWPGIPNASPVATRTNLLTGT